MDGNIIKLNRSNDIVPVILDTVMQPSPIEVDKELILEENL